MQPVITWREILMRCRDSLQRQLDSTRAEAEISNLPRELFRTDLDSLERKISIITDMMKYTTK